MLIGQGQITCKYIVLYHNEYIASQDDPLYLCNVHRTVTVQ